MTNPPWDWSKARLFGETDSFVALGLASMASSLIIEGALFFDSSRANDLKIGYGHEIAIDPDGQPCQWYILSQRNVGRADKTNSCDAWWLVSCHDWHSFCQPWDIYSKSSRLIVLSTYCLSMLQHANIQSSRLVTASEYYHRVHA